MDTCTRSQSFITLKGFKRASISFFVSLVIYAGFIVPLIKNHQVRLKDEPVKESLPLWDLRIWMENRNLSIYQSRKHQIAKVCKSYNITNPLFSVNNLTKDQLAHKLDKFLFSKEDHLMACIINKVASSSLVYTFLKLKGIQTKTLTSPHSLLDLITTKNMKDFLEMDQKFFKFIFVRNPIDRLISVYYNKALNSQNITGLGAFGLDVKRQGGALIKKRKKKPFYKESSNSSQPTFEEFLEFILASNLEGEGFASHWGPYWKVCAPCNIDYDVIGKLETGDDDFTYVWKKTGISSRVPILYSNSDRNSEATRKNQDQLAQLLRQAPRELLVRVFHAYRLDFELFSYNFDVTLSIAGYEKLTEEEMQKI